ncbi:MAG TPA: glutamyl-tRNA reductase [Myxococcales bacterium]|nr:glutamyl-tRNA reductase [Myxococcales bacterium]
MALICVGISHRQAPIAVREQLAIPDELLPDRVKQLTQLAGVKEAMIVSTCNRLEVFAVAGSHEPAEDIVEALGALAAPHAVCRFDEEALRHLFRVAASLDSMVVGEAQILGQVKEAAAQARQAGALGAEMQRALQAALKAAKRVRTETEIARGVVSLSSVAVQLAKKLLGDLRQRPVLLLGAGEMAQLAARELKTEGAREILVANRSPARAEELAREVGGVPVSLGELPQLLERADIAICSTAASAFVVTQQMMAAALKARRYRPIFLVDLTLPRNVEPSANQLENVYVYDLDDLERVAAQNRELREAHVAAAEAIVDHELKAFLAQQRERRAVPVLAQLRAHAEAVARAEAERTLAALPGLDERQQMSVRAMANAIVNKLLHAPTARLRTDGEGPLGDAAAALFGLSALSSSAEAPGQTGPSPVPIPVPDPAPDPQPGHSEGSVLPLLRNR